MTAYYFWRLAYNFEEDFNEWQLRMRSLSAYNPKVSLLKEGILSLNQIEQQVVMWHVVDRLTFKEMQWIFYDYSRQYISLIYQTAIGKLKEYFRKCGYLIK